MPASDGRVWGEVYEATHPFVVLQALDELEGKVEVFDLGRKKTAVDELNELESNAGVEQELAEMKKRLGNRIRPQGA